MQQATLQHLVLAIVFAPLIGGVIAGILGKPIGRKGATVVTILGVGIAFVCALLLFNQMILQDHASFDFAFYTWAISGHFQFDVAFLVDRLTASMMVVVTFVSLLVHVYSIGYMQEDSGYQRFFSYMSLFTFFMLALVGANNFALLFFGWEGVGLVSYLLIGFWFSKKSAAEGSLKAFIVNRVGDFGFILGLAAILDYFGSLNYATVFAKAPDLANKMIHILPYTDWHVMTVICILLFIGAMGKSAQVPLHVWLPESMEGPTPISALIHAATMVTAGVYMVARLSPMFELSTTALSVVLIIGATGALFMGILGIIANDIKRVIAYSTMSQLGYMMAGNGASAFSAGMFHLFTHACFKALLFLAAGSVIIAMHHEQDMRKMGGLRKYMPITYVAFLFGALALAAIPPFAGFYSKDAIIDAVHHTTIFGASYAYWCLVIGAFVTGLYIFRAFFMTFHTKPRMDEKTKAHLKESSWVVTIPLICLAIPSLLLGYFLAAPILKQPIGMLGKAIYVLPSLNPLISAPALTKGFLPALTEAFTNLPVYFALAGILVAWLTVIKYPALPAMLARRFSWIYKILYYKFGFDSFNDWVFVRGSINLAKFFYRVLDLKVLDGMFVNGSGHGVVDISKLLKRLQNGYLYSYAFAMILGLFVFLVWWVIF